MDLVIDPAGKDGQSATVVLVELPGFKANVTVPGLPAKVVPIRMSRSDFKVGKVPCNRTQVPLDLAWAVTIHKSQGLTIGPEEAIKMVIVDFGKNEAWAPGLMYVAVSRVTHLECLAIDLRKINEAQELEVIPFNRDRLANLNKSKKSQAIFEYLAKLKEKMQA